MARKISITLDASDQHEHALAWRLKKDKAEKEANGHTPHDDAEALLTEVLSGVLDTMLTEYQQTQGTKIRDALLTASADDCAKVAEILKCEWP